MKARFPYLWLNQGCSLSACPGEAGLAEGSYQAIRVHMRTFANKRRRSWSRFRSPPGLHVSHGLLQSSDTQGSRRRGNDGPHGSLFTTQRAVVHKRKRTKKKIRNLPRLWISRSPMTKLQKAATAPPAYPQPVAVPYTSLAICLRIFRILQTPCR